MGNGVAEVRAEQTFHVLLSNFGRTAEKLPKGTIISYATKSPFSILQVYGPLGLEVAKYLNIPTPMTPEADDARNEDIHTYLEASEGHTAEENAGFEN